MDLSRPAIAVALNTTYAAPTLTVDSVITPHASLNRNRDTDVGAAPFKSVSVQITNFPPLAPVRTALMSASTPMVTQPAEDDPLLARSFTRRSVSSAMGTKSRPSMLALMISSDTSLGCAHDGRKHRRGREQVSGRCWNGSNHENLRAK